MRPPARVRNRTAGWSSGSGGERIQQAVANDPREELGSLPTWREMGEKECLPKGRAAEEEDKVPSAIVVIRAVDASS